MKKFIVSLIIAAGVVACYPTEKTFLRSYVMSYSDLNYIHLNLWGGGIEILALPIEITSDDILVSREEWNSVSLGNYKSTGELKKSYDALCVKYGDMTFNREVTTWTGSGPGHDTHCLGVGFVSIEIVSDADFDDLHPAGESLGDVFIFSSSSVKPYIDREYSGEEHTRINEKVSDLTATQMVLLSGGTSIGKLTIESSPTLAKTHNFTVTMTADDGRVFSDSIEITFE